MKIGNLFNLLNHGSEVGRLENWKGGIWLNLIITISPLCFTGDDLKEKLNNSQRRNK